MASEWDIAKANALIGEWRIPILVVPADPDRKVLATRDVLAEALTAARAQGRIEGLEQAAGIVAVQPTSRRAVDAISARIAQLKEAK